MKIKISVPCNDVFGDKFDSKLDEFFTAKVESNRYGKYSTWNKEEVRSALATTRRTASKYWTQGQIGVSSPVRKN